MLFQMWDLCGKVTAGKCISPEAGSEFSTKDVSAVSIIYISHGGGPLPLLGDMAHNEMIEVLQDISRNIKRPSAIIMVSAHWEEQQPTITSAAQPALIYDYYGFPEESYSIQYPAPGNPALATKVFEKLKQAKIDAVLDDKRGFDHGLFVPLKIMYPEADIPCIQLSLVNDLDPAIHLHLGKALAELNDDTTMIIGSGFSFHNLRAFFKPATQDEITMNAEFEQWLNQACASQDLTEAERELRLMSWAQTPAARFCHPREEHLLPLHVCYGAAGKPARQVFNYEVMGKKVSSYLW